MTCRPIKNLAVSLIIFAMIHFHGIPSVQGQDYQSFEQEMTRIKTDTKIRIGPFRLFPALVLKNIGYDSNVYYQHRDNAPQSDYTFTLSPELTAYAVYRRKIIFSLAVNPEFVYYREQKQEGGFNLSLRPGIKFQLFKKLVLAGDYFWNSLRYRATSEFDVRVREIRKGYSGSLYYSRGKSLSLGLSGQMEDIVYEDIDSLTTDILFSQSLNRQERSAFFDLSYDVFNQKGDVFLRSGYTDYRFENIQSAFRNSGAYQISAGINFPLLGLIRGKLSAGYKKLVPRTKEEEGFSGLVVDTNLKVNWSKLSLQVSYRRDFQFSYWTKNIFYHEDIFGGGIQCYPVKFFRLDYYLNFGKSRYPKPVQLITPDGDVTELLRMDQYRIHTAGIVFKLKKKLGLGVSFNFWKRTSNQYWANRDRTFVGMFLTNDF